MKVTAIDARSERMLELLSQGASSREVAASLGYQEGTMRVYLHHLYRKLGVANKTEAVVWYLRRGDAVPASPPSKAASSDGSRDVFGDMALEEGLFTALGAMGAFIGPYSRVWEVGMRLKGEAIGTETRARQELSRLLWRALLKGDWNHAKRMVDADCGRGMMLDAPSEAMLLASLLLLGGFSSAGERIVAQLAGKKRGYVVASPREIALIRSLEEAIAGSEDRLQAIAGGSGEKSSSPILKQIALALLFHVRALRKDADCARDTANLLWGQAESARQQLEAMGERPFATRRQAASGAKVSMQRASAREKAAAR